MNSLSYFCNLNLRDKGIFVGLFLSRFDLTALAAFGFKTFHEAFNMFGYSLKLPSNSIKNYRDEFDPYFDNPRVGRARNIRVNCKKIMDDATHLKFEDFYFIINSYLHNDHIDSADAKPFDLAGIKSRSFSISRMITGKAAENYFIDNYNRISPFSNCELVNTTNFGCGYDFRMTNGVDRFYVEVKGLNTDKGGLLMTEKEFDVAEQLKDKYCLFIVKNFIQTPEHTLFFNPTNNPHLSLTKQERTVTLVSYMANI